MQYERLSNPLVILAAAPLALIGVIGALWLADLPLSAPLMIGVVLLIGVVVNNAILLVEYIEIGRREHGLAPFDAIIEAGVVRLRPILMTTSTTVLGVTPLAIGFGEGVEIIRPLALTVVGGLSLAMVLTLLVVPCLYLIINGTAERTQAWLTGGMSAYRLRRGSAQGRISSTSRVGERQGYPCVVLRIPVPAHDAADRGLLEGLGRVAGALRLAVRGRWGSLPWISTQPGSRA